jgi:UDP-N-acetylmuramoyl-tripeptide--D-alanyl-D-alanine ligase
MRGVTALWTSDAIATATGGAASAPFTVDGVAFDSREVGPGDLFIALKGETTDGHRFVEQAFAQGAGGAIVSTPCEGPHVLVADTTTALEALGRASRARTLAKIAGVTGSVGKTGTKEALAAALARGQRGHVHRSVKSYNNHTGVPLSLARMPAETAFGVFEMGMNHAGEIAALTRQARPHVALITAIAPAHIEFFANGIEGIADAKGEIFEGLEPGGTAILPHDSPHRDRLIRHAEPHAARVLAFGRGDGADVRILDAISGLEGTTITLALPEDRELTFTLSQPGEHWISNAAAVIAAVYALGGDLAAAGLALAEMGGLAGRGARYAIVLPDGEATLIDESYNANPVSMAATLKLLGEAPGRRIAVLGEMRELGTESATLHAGLAPAIRDARVDLALLVGEAMVPLAEALEGVVETRHVADADAARESLEEAIAPGDTVLIKGSNAVGLARIVVALTGGRT